MKKEKLQKIGEEWKVLDETYDSIVQGLIDGLESSPVSTNRLAELREMQRKLFNLEVKLYKILQEK